MPERDPETGQFVSSKSDGYAAVEPRESPEIDMNAFQERVAALLRQRTVGAVVDGETAVLNYAVLADINPTVAMASLSSVLCKLWRWILGVAKSIVQGVLEVVQFVADAALDILGELVDSIFDGESTLGTIVKLALIGGLAYIGYSLLAGKRKDDDDGNEDRGVLNG